MQNPNQKLLDQFFSNQPTIEGQDMLLIKVDYEQYWKLKSKSDSLAPMIEVNNQNPLKKGIYLNFADKKDRANPIYKHKLIQPKLQPVPNQSTQYKPHMILQVKSGEQQEVKQGKFLKMLPLSCSMNANCVKRGQLIKEIPETEDQKYLKLKDIEEQTGKSIATLKRPIEDLLSSDEDEENQIAMPHLSDAPQKKVQVQRIDALPYPETPQECQTYRKKFLRIMLQSNQAMTKKDMYRDCNFSPKYVDLLAKELCENKGGKYALTKQAKQQM